MANAKKFYWKFEDGRLHQSAKMRSRRATARGYHNTPRQAFLAAGVNSNTLRALGEEELEDLQGVVPHGLRTVIRNLLGRFRRA